MAKAVKDHRSKKNPSGHSAWRAHTADLRSGDRNEIIRQGNWRIACLRVRRSAGKLTEKNKKEIVTLLGEHSSDSLILAAK